MHSKLNFVEAISTCFSQCYVFTMFIFLDRRWEGEEQKQRKKRRTVIHQWRAAPFHHQPPSVPPPRCSSPSPSPSPSLSSAFSTALQCEQWRVTGLRRFHHPSIHHRRAALPLPLLRLGCSPLFMVRPVWPKPKCVGPVWPSKIKKSKIFSQILCFIKKKLVFNINQRHYIITLERDRMMT